MKKLPPNVAPYQRTREFSEDSIPRGLRHRHATKSGVWAEICVLEGALRYRILSPDPEEHVVSAENTAIVEPEVPHEVEPLGQVRFFVQFFR